MLSTTVDVDATVGRPTAVPKVAVRGRGRAATGNVAAFEELRRDGAIGPATLALLHDLGAQVTRTSSFPPPPSHGTWSDPAVDELLADMLSQPGDGAAFVIACLAKADDQASLERLLLTSIRNYLIDEAKKTERGKLRRRLEGLLGNDPRFVRVRAAEAGFACWTLRDAPEGLWQGDIEELEEAAWQVRGVAITRWNTAGPTPTGTKHALLRVAEAVVMHAGGCVRDEDLTRVVQQRFVLLARDGAEPLPGSDDDGDIATATEDNAPWLLEASEDRAQELYASLSTAERSAVPLLGGTDVEMAAVLGVGRRKAKTVAQAVAEKLRIATIDDEDRDHVLAALLRLCEEPP